jgi:hypothetical protein
MIKKIFNCGTLNTTCFKERVTKLEMTKFEIGGEKVTDLILMKNKIKIKDFEP